MRKTIARLSAALPLAGLLLLGACSRQVTIAVPVPLTGDQAEQGKDVLNGAQLAVDEWNARGGVLGRKIALESADDKGEEERAAALAKEWGNRKVAAVIGHYNSSSTLAAMEVYYEKRTLMITPSSTNADVTERGYPTIFRVCGRDDQQAQVAAAYVAKYFPDAKVALLHDKSPYGQELANQFLRDYQTLTKKESVYYGGFDRSTAEFAPIVAKLKEAAPTVVYFGGLFPQGSGLAKALREGGVNATFMSGDGCFDAAFLKGAGAAGEGALCTFFPDIEGLASAKAEVAAYRAKFGVAPGPYSLFAYVAADLALQGIAKAGTADAVPVARALHSGEFQTPLGTFGFNEKGDPVHTSYVVWKVQGGKFVPVDMNAPAPAPAQ